MRHWHTQDIKEVFEIVSSRDHGLSALEAISRLEHNGPNILPTAKPKSVFYIFLSQFKSPIIYVLGIAGIILFFLHETIDALIILFVLLFNASVGSIQEGKAQRTLLALKNFSETNTTVFRDGKGIVISDKEVVVGDIILIEEGEKIPADGRVLVSHGLTVDESAITGESSPVAKTSDTISKMNIAISDRHNMLYKGTHALSGSGRMVVIATGIETFIGQITKKIAHIESEIPLQGDIRRLSRVIISTVIILSVSLFAFGFFYGRDAVEMFKTVVALSVSIIPEGLPIVITLVLAAGVWRMSKRNVLVKKLQAVEALGQARIIAVDKTGTITKNELIVSHVFVSEKEYEVTGMGYEPKGEIKFSGETIEPLNHQDLVLMAKISALVPNAHISFVPDQKQWKIGGDPTEAAMLAFAGKIGFHRDILEEESPRIFELPFDYKEKYHATIHEEKRSLLGFVAGAPESILNKSEYVLRGGRAVKLEGLEKEELLGLFMKYAGSGMRVIALAYMHEHPGRTLERDRVKNLVFVGYLGMRDAPRVEARLAIQKAQNAGMRVVMITGDHKDAARAIAKEAGIFKTGDKVLTGDEIHKLNDVELSNALIDVSVFARVTPDDKLKIIQAYKKRGEIIAMTGDGVNDAPSLVAADLGIAMGKIGTEVAKEASDVVIVDDNFESIVAGIEEGRNIYKTIKKVILYLFSTSVGEVLVIMGALGLGWPLPILAAQIIWLNLVTDGFLDISLAMEPKEDGLLNGSFKRPGRYLIDTMMVKRMMVMAVPMTIGTLGLFGFYLAEEGLPKALTVSLAVLAAFQWFNAWNCRSESESVFKGGLFTNRALFASTILVVGLQYLAIYTPFFQEILRTVPLQALDIALVLGVASSILFVEEIRKFFYRRGHKIDIKVVQTANTA